MPKFNVSTRTQDRERAWLLYLSHSLLALLLWHQVGLVQNHSNRQLCSLSADKEPALMSERWRLEIHWRGTWLSAWGPYL